MSIMSEKNLTRRRKYVLLDMINMINNDLLLL
jgi:hypothetical protein